MDNVSFDPVPEGEDGPIVLDEDEEEDDNAGASSRPGSKRRRRGGKSPELTPPPDLPEESAYSLPLSITWTIADPSS